MMKRIIYTLLLPFSNIIFGQLAIQTPNPQQLFHVDAKKNNVAIGAPSATEIKDDFVVTNTGLVGIGLIQPMKSLDVNADSKAITIRNLLELSQFSTSGANELLIRDDSVGDITATTLIFPLQEVVDPNTYFDFTVPASNNVIRGTINVTMYNACGRTMMSQFAFMGNSLQFIGGMGRDVIGIGSILGNGIVANSQESVIWRIQFPNVTGCEDGGNGSQFNFDIQKIGLSSFRVTSRSNVRKEIKVSVERL